MSYRSSALTSSGWLPDSEARLTLSRVSNLHGPRTMMQRTYMHTVLAAFFYGAPVWNREVSASTRFEKILSAAPTSLSNSESLSDDVATAIAGMLSVDLMAHGQAENFRWLEAIRMRGEYPPSRAIEAKRRRYRISGSWSSGASA